MSWHYLQALVEASSARTCSDGEPSAPWRRSPTVEKCSCDGNRTACFPCSQSGTTATPSRVGPGLASWMSSLQDSRASRSALPANKREPTTAETDGQQPFASWTKSDQASFYWRTSQACLPLGMGTLDRYSETWPRSGTTLSGIAFLLQPSARRIAATDSGFLPTPIATNTKAVHLRSGGRPPRTYIPTPTAGDAKSSGSRNLEGSKANHGVSLTDWVRTGDSTAPRQGMFPTPQTTQWPNEGNMRLMRGLVLEGKVSREEAQQMIGKDPFAAQGNLQAMEFPTPSASDWKGSAKEGQRRGQLTDPAKGAIPAGGKLNPTWVAWLMAWPIGWTNLEPLAMDRWQAWCLSHGIACARKLDSDDV